MKKFYTRTPILGMVVMMLITSCSKDDSSNPTGHTIVFGGITYTIADGFIIDYESVNPIEESNAPTHYNYEFYLVDAKLTTIIDDGDSFIGASETTTFAVYVDLYSPGTAGFQAGTFTYVNDDTATESDVDGKFVFLGGEVELDNDGVEQGDLDGPEFNIAGGTVTIQGSSPTDYSITLDLITSDGKTVTGSYSGTFGIQKDA